MKKIFFLVISALILGTVSAQVTTSSMNGTITDAQGEPLVGATVVAVHTPSGTQYGTITGKDGRYNMASMRTGGPYTVTFSFVGYQPVAFPDLTLQLGETLTRNAFLKDTQELDAVVVVADGKNSAMNINRAGAVTSITSEEIQLLPSVSRSMNDIMRLTPQASSTTSGLAIGGGNYRQSFVTVDGAAFNNAFGIGGNLPSGGTPISLDALEQVSVAVTPFDVRQSGFVGGSINAVTKSGTNRLKVSAYNYYKSEKLQGDKYDSDKKLTLDKMLSNTFGFNIGAPIVKDKLFIFTNFEYDWNTNPGETRLARQNSNDKFGSGSQYNRPTVDQMEMMKSFLMDKYGYNPGRYQDYSTQTPGWKLIARVDWNINKNHTLNVRFSTTKNKYSASASSSISPLINDQPNQMVSYDRTNFGRASNYALNFESSRYYQEQNFTSVAAELNSRFLEGRLTNTLRATYSRQHEPRSYEGRLFPTVDILEETAEGTPAVLTTFGLDPFTYGNLRDVSTYVVTDEVGYSTGIHNLTAGLQFEHDNTKNGYMQGGAGYYVYNSWDDFTKDKTPAAFAITHANRTDLKQTYPSFKFMQFSLYLQDEMNISERLKATFGIRFEIPTYPSLDGNENAEFTKLFAANGSYKTSDMPKARLNVSPRFGFNWDMTGERKYILRGGTGVFTGRMPFVWIVSAVGNSNCDQAQTILYNSKGDDMPSFHDNINDILTDLYGGTFEQKALPAPQSPTVLDKNLKMPSTWKSSLAFDLKLPAGIDLNLEAIYNQDINSIAVSKLGQVEKVGGIQIAGEPEPRRFWTSQGIKNSDGRTVNPYLIKNSDIDGWYYSLTAQANKRFGFGLSVMAAYTYSKAKNVIDGIGDQVTSAYNTNTFNQNGSNTPELGYSSYVSPHRVLLNINYRKEYGKHFGTSVSLYYEAFQLGYIGSYSYSRYSYTMGNVTGDGGAQNLLYVPTEEQWQQMNFKDQLDPKDKTKVIYSAAQQKADFWDFVNNDKYLSEHKGDYTERGGAVMPWQHMVNFRFAQDFFVNVKGKRNTITLGIDINNIANLLNKHWGNATRLNSSNLLDYKSADQTYQYNKPTWAPYASTISTWSAMFSVRYTFN